MFGVLGLGATRECHQRCRIGVGAMNGGRFLWLAGFDLKLSRRLQRIPALVLVASLGELRSGSE